MGYCIVVSKRVQKELDSLPKAIYIHIREQIITLRNNPRPSGVKKLRGYVSTYRVRVGDYRIVYEVDDSAQEIRLLHVADRKDV